MNHGEHKPSADLEIKLQVLTFANLFLCRQVKSPWSPCPEGVKDKRAKDAARVTEWLRQSNDDASFDPWNGSGAPQLTQETLANNRERMVSELRTACKDTLCDLEATVSLLDLLPEFITLASTLIAYRGTEKGSCAEHISEFMLQASLEQFYIYGNTKTALVDEAFAWDRVDSVGPSFEEDGQTEMDTRVPTDQKARFKDILLPDGRLSWNWHLRGIAQEFPLLRFEDATLHMLERLLNLLDKPILTQLEEGKLEGLSESETTEFKERVGFV